MVSLLIVVFLMAILFKITFFMFHIVGKILGGILGVIGWLLLGSLAVTVFGLTLITLPIILIVGFVTLIAAAVA